jgi:hypothetical protein
MSIAINTANEVPSAGKEIDPGRKNANKSSPLKTCPIPRTIHLKRVMLLNFVNLNFSYETVYTNYSAGHFFHGNFCPG